MRKNLLAVFLFLGIICPSLFIHAQNDRFAFAITDLQPTGASWNALRKLDLRNGKFGSILINGTDASVAAIDARSGKQIVVPAEARIPNSPQAAFSTGVAAMAYDKKNNRLYFTPMFIDQLRYVDLKTMKLYYVTDESFTKTGINNDEAKIISRMAIGPDGVGYAISNDASTFIRFTTGKNIQITNLGSLVDDPSNGGVSIHNKCSSWGGDMIPDDEGNFYILTSRNSIFKLETQTKAVKLLGYMKGLPQDFTTNGAVVTPEGKILVSSAVNGSGYFLVDPNDWSATLFPAPEGIFRSSDLANSNYLRKRANNPSPEFTINTLLNDNTPGKIMVYPNPVGNDQFNLQFGKVTPGKYDIEMTDAMGRLIMQRNVNVQAEDQVENILLKPAMARGVYLIKVIDQEKRSVLSQKLVVQ